MTRSSEEVRSLAHGLLWFVHTPFNEAGEVNIPRLREHMAYMFGMFEDRPSCAFVACGSGEFWSLDLAEYRTVVRAAVAEVGHKVPVVAGVGYGTRIACQFARAAEEEGADAVLVFPPYLIGGPQEGLYQHYATVARATRLAVMLYNRDNAVFEPQTVARLVEAHPHIIGLKDGFGDIERLTAMRTLLGERLRLMNGMPMAEMYAPTYCKAGIRAYSPTAIEFLPELAWAFDHALERGDAAELERLMDGFYRPFTALRNQVPGYGVALTKAALRLRERPSGGVRPPLVNPAPEHVAQLAELLERGLALVRSSG